MNLSIRGLFAIIIVWGVALGLNGLGETFLKPEKIEPHVAYVNDHILLRYSYIPRTSLFRTASSWYDRVIERYENKDYESKSEFTLVDCEVYVYHYPIFKGKPKINVEPCSEVQR